jgi:hypothetical protein
VAKEQLPSINRGACVTQVLEAWGIGTNLIAALPGGLLNTLGPTRELLIVGGSEKLFPDHFTKDSLRDLAEIVSQPETRSSALKSLE